MFARALLERNMVDGFLYRVGDSAAKKSRNQLVGLASYRLTRSRLPDAQRSKIAIASEGGIAPSAAIA